jgi:hypothetical protein
MSASKRVTKSDLHPRLAPITDPVAMPVLPDRTWSDEEWQRIQLGYSSRDMDEKWDVYAEGNVVYIHRSWTGRGFFEATFIPIDGGWHIGSAVRESPEKYSGVRDDDYGCVMLELVLSGIVLGERAQELRARLVQLVQSRQGNSDASPGIIQHSMLGLRSEP